MSSSSLCRYAHATARLVGIEFDRIDPQAMQVDKRRYCSKECCNTFVAQRPKMSRRERSATTYVEWLFLQPLENHGGSLGAVL